MIIKKPADRQVAWSQFKFIKAYDPDDDGDDDTNDPNDQNDKRYIEGIATTPTPDRMGDIVDPAGCSFDLPIPFLWQHNSDEPIGNVTSCVQTAKGITVKVEMPKMDIPGVLKDRLDEAYQSIKLGLVRGMSIGFAPLEYAYMEDTGGYRFSRWEWLELSAVTIPANMEASIATIKSLDRRQRRSPGKTVRLSAASLQAKTGLIVPRKRMADWCDASSETVDEIAARRERLLR